jgi:hypothetical protein
MLFIAAFAACLACTAPVYGADLLTTLLNDYVDDQQLDPCRYTEKQLRGLRDAIPNDAAAYAADLGAAIDDALASRARGACKKDAPATGANTTAPPASSTTAPPPPPAASTGAPAAVAPTPATPAAAQPPPTPDVAPVAAPDVAARDAIGIATQTTEPGTGAPFPLLALAILAALLAFGTALVGLVRWRAWQPAWADRFSHAAGEAGWRASSTFAEFADFVRLGR